jgi:acetyltransferase-like isoleucine patch superfamily enzyme
MGYLTHSQLAQLNFRSLGQNVSISDKCAIYGAEKISIGDNSRIDDFCVLSGEITIGRHVHIAVFCNLASGESSITLQDFVGLAFGCHIIAQSDDYSGRSMTNPTIPKKFKKEISSPITIGIHSILGTGTIVLPGVQIPAGVSSGANTLFNKSAEEWSVYVGSPARRVKERSRELLKLEQEFWRDKP